MNEQRHELCVIGAGTAGFAAAQAARALGREVVLVAGRDELGGTCIRRGCMPAKAVLAASHFEGEVVKAPGVGIETGPVHVDMQAIVRRKRALVDYFAADRVHELQAYPLVRGDARFVAPDTVAVDGRRIRAERFVIATGARNLPPDIEGWESVDAMTSTDVLKLETLPASVAIVGGGPIGCAFGQYFARLGAHVTLFQDAPELLRGDDADVGAAVREALERDGIEVVLDAHVQRVARTDGEIEVFARTPAGPRSVRCARVMLATNRRPDVAGLDLAAGQVEGDAHRGVVVHDTLRSPSNARVYAAGDVLGRRALVHTAEYAGALAARNAFSGDPQPAAWDRWEAHALYTDPQVAVAGLTERQCRERGIAVDVASLPATEVGKALVGNEPDGFVKMLVRRDDNRVAGIAIVTAEAIDLIGEAIALLSAGATARDVAAMPHLHPTMSELLLRVAEKLVPAGG